MATGSGCPIETMSSVSMCTCMFACPCALYLQTCLWACTHMHVYFVVQFLHAFSGCDTKLSNRPAHHMSYTKFGFHFACLCTGWRGTFAVLSMHHAGPIRHTILVHPEPLLMAAASFCAEEESCFQKFHLTWHAWWKISFNLEGLIVLITPSLQVRMHFRLTPGASHNSMLFHNSSHASLAFYIYFCSMILADPAHPLTLVNIKKMEGEFEKYLTSTAKKEVEM